MKKYRIKGGVSRRAFLFGGSILLVGIGTLASIFVFQPTLKALVDTIIPADEFGPAASQTGAVEHLCSAMKGRISSRIQIRAAIAWLNWQAGGSFAMASAKTKIQIVTELAQSPSGSNERRFYDWVRGQTMLHYYGSAARAQALGFVGAPQPTGHPDAWLPWNRRS